MQDNDWVDVIAESELKEESRKAVVLAGAPVALIRKKGREIYAISNKCPHLGCLLASGELEGYILKCPCHDWRFDIRSGEFIDAPEIKIAVYRWKIEGGRIWLNITGGAHA